MKYKLSNETKYQEYLKACELNRKGYSNKEVIENTLFPTWRVLEFYMYRNDLKLPYTNMPKKHKSNDSFFEEIDCFKKAYLLGVMYSDGCIYDNTRFGFCLAKQDEELIDYIRENICPTAFKKEILNKKGAKNRQPQIVLRVSNNRIINTLKTKWGVKERKTLNEGLVFPNIGNDLLWSFILGLTDGDGSIYFRGDHPKLYPSLRITICMTDLPFLLKLQDFIVSEGISIKLYTKQGKTCKYYILSTSNNSSAIKFCERIYKNADFFLKRKFDKYQSYCKYKNLDNTELNSEITKGSESV